MVWRANVPLTGELWVRFLKAETETVFTEVCLGTRMRGEEIYTTEELGFDPLTEKWAISLILVEFES
jgi:hypothetical protein